MITQKIKIFILLVFGDHIRVQILYSRLRKEKIKLKLLNIQQVLSKNYFHSLREG